MSKQCQKCHEHVSEDAFICPHCGAILGQSVQKAKPIPKPKKPEKEIKLPSLPWLGPIVMAILIVALALSLPRYLKELAGEPEATATTQYAPTISTTSATTEPLITYRVQVKTGRLQALENVLVEVYQEGSLLTSCVTGSDGRATFSAPQSDDYQLRLVGLPIYFDINFRDSVFAFPEGEQELVISLQKLPVPYVVRVVNSDGVPIAGVGLDIFAHTEFNLVTDADGICSIKAEYQAEGYYVSIRYLPDDYANEQTIYYFDEYASELVIVLPKIEEVIPEGMIKHTVHVIDEYGQPVVDTPIFVTSDDQNILFEGITNQDGGYTFIGSADVEYKIGFMYLPDYSNVLFPFADEINFLLIELNLDREWYYYTVYVVDADSNPMPGIYVHYNAGNQSASRATDENGMVIFAIKESDPSKIKLSIYTMVDGLQTIYKYTFPNFSRETTIRIETSDDESNS